MSTVAQVLTPEFPRSWHEAVAIVQEIAAQLQPGMGLPSPEDLVLEDSGALVFGFASESAGSPVEALGGLLQGLLNGVEAPAALRALAAENAGPTPAHTTVESFSRALAFFERPNRSGDLLAVAGRLQSFRERTSTEKEFERLREKVAASDGPAEEKPAGKPRLTKQQQRIAAVVLAILLPLTMVIFFGLPGGLRTVLTRAGSSADHVIAAGLGQMGFSSSASAEASKATAEAEAPPVTEAVERQRPAVVPQPRPPAGAAAVQPRSNAPARPDGAPPAARDERPDAIRARNNTPVPFLETPLRPNTTAPTVAEAFPSFVYSPEDRQVLPPALLRPQLPREPAPGAATGYFHLLIDETGTVQEVRLVSPTRRFQDRMLVAAAKAWKFSPAMLDGEPVKYRLAVPIILPAGMP